MSEELKPCPLCIDAMSEIYQLLEGQSADKEEIAELKAEVERLRLAAQSVIQEYRRLPPFALGNAMKRLEVVI